MAFLGSLFDASERFLKKTRPLVASINNLEPEYEKFDDDGLKSLTADFRSRIEAGEKLDNLIAPSFALVREAAKRVISQRPFDTQLIGGIALHNKRIAEMKTGEEKLLQRQCLFSSMLFLAKVLTLSLSMIILQDVTLSGWVRFTSSLA